jgi:hypothetical protein
MNEIYYPTKQTNKAENFQSFLMTDDLTIQRTRFMIHKAKRLGKIFESEWKDLLSENLYSELSGRMRIQKLLESRQDNHTKQIKPIIRNFFLELKPVFTESVILSMSFVSFWILAVILRSVKL